MGITRSSTAPPLLPIHAHFSNRDSVQPPVPLQTMAPLSQARYEQLDQADSSHSEPEDPSPLPGMTQTPSSEGDGEEAEGIIDQHCNKYSTQQLKFYLL